MGSIATSTAVWTTAKHLEPPSIAKSAAAYSYYLDYQRHQLTAPESQLIDEIAKQPRAQMMGSPDEAQFLAWLCGLLDAKRVLEVGVFRGSTTLTLARALPAGGQVVGLDVSAQFLEDCGAQKFWEAAGVSGKIDFRLGPAVESMDKLIGELKSGGDNKFDLCFIDADKLNYEEYYERALKLVRKGGVIAIDNTLWMGNLGTSLLEAETVTASSPDASTIARLNKKLLADERVAITMLGIADGITLCRVK